MSCSLIVLMLLKMFDIRKATQQTGDMIILGNGGRELGEKEKKVHLYFIYSRTICTTFIVIIY